MRLQSADGTTLALHEFGGDGPDLLIAHATGFCAGSYGPLAAVLGSSFHVWALDVRGHGDSATPESGTIDWLAGADDVLAAIAAIGGPVVGLGHSMGGALLARAELQQPGSLRGAWLFEPIITPQREDWAASENPLSISARRRRAVFPSRAEAMSRYASRPPLGVLRADCLAAYVNEGFRDVGDEVELKCAPTIEAATFEASGAITIDDVATIDLPAVIARGERGDTSMGPAAIALEIADTWPGAELQRFAHVGHFGPLQDPDTIAESVVTRFA